MARWLQPAASIGWRRPAPSPSYALASAFAFAAAILEELDRAKAAAQRYEALRRRSPADASDRVFAEFYSHR
jgi:hypothetical protein